MAAAGIPTTEALFDLLEDNDFYFSMTLLNIFDDLHYGELLLNVLESRGRDLEFILMLVRREIEMTRKLS